MYTKVRYSFSRNFFFFVDSYMSKEAKKKK